MCQLISGRYKQRLNKLTESYVVSNQKIKKALKKELPLTVTQGLKITADSFNRTDEVI